MSTTGQAGRTARRTTSPPKEPQKGSPMAGSGLLPNSCGFFPDAISRPFTRHAEISLKAGPGGAYVGNRQAWPGSPWLGCGGAGGSSLPGGDQGPGLSMSSLCVGGHSTTSPEFTDAHENGVQGTQGGHLTPILPGPQLWCRSGSLTRLEAPEGGLPPFQHPLRCPGHSGSPGNVY